MRSVPQSVSRKLLQTVQTMSNESDPKTILRLRRAQLPIESGTHFEKILVSHGNSSMSDASIAIEHSKQNSDVQTIWVSAIDGDKCRIFKARSTIAIRKTSFVEQDFGEDAIACSIAFDAITKTNSDGTEEFVTGTSPWIFWVSPDGALHARLLGANQDTTLFSSNVLKVSAVRASYSSVERFNFGLIVFVLLDSGALMYRQFINNVWYDAEVVSFGPTGVTFKDISAFRTWDYRVGIQGITEDGHVYELFTQYEGIGTRSQEHIEITDISASGVLTSVTYHDTQETEHIEVTEITAEGHIWSALDPEIIDAWNTFVGEQAEEFYTGEEDTPIDYD